MAEVSKSPLKLRKFPIQPEISFDDVQERAIAHRATPLVVLGGPGTGKSATLVARVKSYLASGIDPNSILVLTFDRHRASELNDEIFRQSRGTTSGSLVKTFPALAFAILHLQRAREAGRPPRLRSGPEQDYLIRQLLAGSHEANTHNWPEHLRSASQTRAFATQLRDLISRAIEYDLSPEALTALAKEENFPLWSSAGSFLLEYRRVSSLEEENAFDPSEMITQAIRTLKENPDFLREIRALHQVILVDEFQESDRSHRALLGQLYSDELTLFLDPDSTVGRFRGADPESIAEVFDRFTSSRGQSATKILFTRDYRSAHSLNEIGNHIAQGFTNSRLVEQRMRTSNRIAIEDAQTLTIAQCESNHDEARFIAERFRELHLRDGISYSEMAVIIRAPSTRATTLRRIFASMNIPVREEVQSLPLNAQPAVAPLITLANIAFSLSREGLTPERIEEILPNQAIDDLLLSRYGGADFLSLKRIRATIINNREEGEARTSYQLLREYLITSAATIDWQEFAPVKRIADLIASGKKAIRPGASSEDVLWAIWSNAQDESGRPLALKWQREAIEGDESADRDLDGVLALFEAAARYADQRPGNTGDAFIRQLSHESIASDTIAAQAQRPDVVSILTTHAAKGREWSVVAVAGVEEGIWPNLTPRGSLLGSERLVETLREANASNRTAREFQLAALSALKDDERRLFFNAITRARDYLIVTATSAEESRPSQFFNEISEFLALDDDDLKGRATSSSLTPSRLVAKLRGLAESSDNESDAYDAVAILAHLYRSGIRVAHPHLWFGAKSLSTDKPLFTDDEKIRISPSSFDTLHKCPLKWAFENSGGRDGDSAAQIIGTTFHAIAAQLKDGATLGELQSEMNTLWGLLQSRLEIGSGWSAKAELTRALMMLEKLVGYQKKHGRELLAAEEKFALVMGNVTISGSVDRLEVTGDGQLYVVDLKTSKYPISKKDGREHPQLKLYQLAITEGQFAHLSPSKESAGALLLYPSEGATGTERPQPPIDPQEVHEMIRVDVETISSHSFTAVENKLCDSCVLKSSCPIRPEGRSLR